MLADLNRWLAKVSLLFDKDNFRKDLAKLCIYVRKISSIVGLEAVQEMIHKRRMGRQGESQY